VSTRLLLDSSAWNRLKDPHLAQARAEQLTRAAVSGDLLVSLPFLLEVGFSARNATEHMDMVDSLLDLPRLVIDRGAEDRALEVQRDLAKTAQHRIPPSDLLVAVLADRHGVGVLHYDHHFDLLAEKTDLDFESIWLAEPGSL
jgi:predicted nucleic acid-binding protein